MCFIQEYRGVAEFIYFVSNSFLVIGLLIAVLQLRHLIKESFGRISRETTNLTLSLLERKLKDIDSAHNVISSHDFYHKMPDFDGEIKGYCRSKVKVNNNWLDVFDSEDATEFYNAINRLLNELETLSQYILSGLADEELSYKLEGSLILTYIKDYKEYVAVMRSSDKDLSYEHIIELYEIWSKKQTHDKMANDCARLERKLKSKVRPKSRAVIGK